MKIAGCLTATEILNANGRVINNPDGTISVFTISPITGLLAPVHLTKPCCEKLGVDGSFFDINSQECRWSLNGTNGCDYSSAFKLVLNPKGNDGTIFSISPEETCTLGVEFDYLFDFTCTSLANLIRGVTSGECRTSIDVFESIGASMTIDVVDIVLGGTVLTKVYEEQFFSKIGTGNLYTYLSGKSADTGFYVCGTTGLTDTECRPVNIYDINTGAVSGSKANCTIFDNQILDLLFQESGLPSSGVTEFKQSISENAFASNWLHFNTLISDPVIISAITNEKIKLTVKLSGSCIDGCLLLDNIKLNKNSTSILRNDIFLSKSPSFELDRIRDNKKAWIANTETTRREFNITKPDGTSPIRYTDYYLDDERQIINTKELDLDINIASAIETDVWCYISDNTCILTGFTGLSTCVVYTASTTSEIIISSGVTSGTTGTTVSGCSIGYSASSTNDCCRAITQTAAFSFESGDTIVAAQQSVMGPVATVFYSDVTALDATALPTYFITGTTLFSNTGGTVPILATNSSNSFWYNSGNTNDGRFNNVAISGGTGSSTTNYYGISYSFNAATGGTYYIGFAANCTGFQLNINNSSNKIFTATGSALTRLYAQWTVLEVTLCSGLNIVEARFSGDTSEFGLEVYKPINFATLTGATSTGSSQANVVFSSKSYVGSAYSLGTSAGHRCVGNTVVNTMAGQPPCAEINDESVTMSSVTSGSSACIRYALINNAPSSSYSYTNCSGDTINSVLNQYESTIFCALENTVSATNMSLTNNGGCGSSTTITTTSTGYTTSSIGCCSPIYNPTTITSTNEYSYKCPSGYTATTGNAGCQKIITTAATFNGSGATIVHGDINTTYSRYGAYFYPNIQTNGALPVYYNFLANLKNQTGGTITALTFNADNSFWSTSGVTLGGRLNIAGISASTSEFLGFSECINSPSGGTYYLGIAADNFCKFSINGQLIAYLSAVTTTNFNLWSIFSITLNAGINLIEMEGKNDGSASSFAAEIYDPINFATLTGATSTGSSQANVIFSTLDRVGTFFDLGTTVGYSCPSGYILDRCTNTICSALSSTSITYSSINITTTATTGCCTGSCGDDGAFSINSLLTQPLSDVITIEDFQYYLTSELIDVKDRKVISGYPTLRSLYDRYMNSIIYCTTNSSKFDYTTMDKFAGLIGNYWVDIIEQVVPATTLWGSTRVYTNTIFDKQKFRYRGYSTLFGDNAFVDVNVLSPANGVSISASATTTVIQGSSTGTTMFFNQGDEHNYDSMYLVQMNNGSEFLGSVNIVGTSGGNNVINETF
jgi:hypothetical protein